LIDNNLKIAALVVFRNEEKRLKTFMSNLRPFCEEILGIEDGSIDNSRAVFESEGGVLIESNSRSPWMNYGEYERRTELLLEGRRRGFKHFLVLDVDEILNFTFLEEFRRRMADLKPGNALMMQMVNLYPDEKNYISNGPWMPSYKPFAFCDSDTLQYPRAKNHFSRVPLAVENNLAIESNGVVLHAQFIPKVEFNVKQSLYRMREFMNHDASPRGINAKYNVTRLESVETHRIPDEWKPLLEYKTSSFDLQTSANMCEVMKLFEQYGVRYYEKLDIWYEVIMMDVWKKENSRKPRVASNGGVLGYVAKLVWHLRRRAGMNHD
jgi:hypothetical protein